MLVTGSSVKLASTDSIVDTYVRGWDRFGLAATNVTLDILGVGSACGCEDLLTYAEWSDGTQWNWGKVSTKEGLIM